MKQLLLSALLFLVTAVCAGQSKLVSYDDLSYLLHNNIYKADTFFTTKEYTLIKKDEKKNTRKYSLILPGGTYNNISIRSDGRRLYVEIETNELQQYNLLYNSISDYLNKETSTNDMQSFKVKDLGNIYLFITDSQPYNPLRRIYNLQVVADKNLTAYN